jgi:hypothetical protein
MNSHGEGGGCQEQGNAKGNSGHDAASLVIVDGIIIEGSVFSIAAVVSVIS